MKKCSPANNLISYCCSLFLLNIFLNAQTTVYLEVYRDGLFDYKVDVSDWVPGETFFDLGGYHYLWTGEKRIDYSKGYGVIEIDKIVVGVDLTPDESGELADIRRKEIELSKKEIGTASAVKIDPVYWHILKQVKRMNSVEGRLSDSHLKKIKKYTGLKGMWIWGEDITDKGLNYLKDMTKMVELSITQTAVTDVGLASLSRLTGLKRLTLSGNEISGKGFDSLVSLYRLEYLDLSQTSLTDQGLASIAHLANLTVLNLEGTLITDSGLAHLENLGNLRRLILTNTQVTFSGEAAQKLARSLPECEIVFF